MPMHIEGKQIGTGAVVSLGTAGERGGVAALGCKN